jgi:hypothetical protein
MFHKACGSNQENCLQIDGYLDKVFYIGDHFSDGRSPLLTCSILLQFLDDSVELLAVWKAA